MGINDLERYVEIDDVLGSEPTWHIYSGENPSYFLKLL